MRKRLLALSILLLLLLSFWAGMQLQKNMLSEERNALILEADTFIASIHRHQELSDVRNCLFYTDARVLRYLINPNGKKLQNVVGSIDLCYKVLDGYYREETDKEIRWKLSEAKLFYDGYQVTAREALKVAIELDIIYGNPVAYSMEGMRRIVELETEKQEQIVELGKFTDKLYKLIQGSW